MNISEAMYVVHRYRRSGEFSMTANYLSPGPTPAEIGGYQGFLALQFGTDWCGHCQVAEPLIEQVLQKCERVSHLRVEDGPGRKLGRLFKVKLWPTLIFLEDGVEQSRVVRPQNLEDIQRALEALRF